MDATARTDGTLNRRTALALGGSLTTLLAMPRDGMAQVQASPEPSREAPNTFMLSGEGVELTYATTSFNGQPTLSYTTPDTERVFRGDQILVEQSSRLGDLVSIMLDSVADAYSDWLTVLLPQINLTGSFDEPTPFATLAIQTRHLSHIGGPNIVDGPVVSYDVMALEGTAELLHY